MNKFAFSLMSLVFRVRDKISPPETVLEQAGLKPGFKVLDYGCGPGSFSIASAKIVGPDGIVYAADINPNAIKSVTKRAEQSRIANIKTILTDCKTGLVDNVIDVVLLYDIYHHLPDPQTILAELHRVLKSEGVLSFSDHHLKEGPIVSGVEKGGLFKLKSRQTKKFTFDRINS